MTARTLGRAAVLVGTAALVLAVPATSALAHPLGNFSVNHYNGLTLRADGVELLTIIDTAEIPTQQAMPSIDADGDDALSPDELAVAAKAQCEAVASAVTLRRDNQPVALELASVTLETVPGAAGLPTLRLTCPRSAELDLSQPAVVTLVDDYRSDRVGWHEITAVGDGVRLIDSPVASASISDELKTYPVDLLESPLDLRSMTVRTEPGQGGPTDSFDPAAGSSDPFTRLVAAGDRALQDLIGDGELTPGIGALAVLLSVLLGAGHAMLPGHGKTVMAAYLAGRRGSRRDAWMVGATVTVTHTASVLVLGLLIALSANVIGEQVLRVLGIVSGAIIAVIGIALLLDALRNRRAARVEPTRVEVLTTAGGHGVDQGPAHSHEHDHVHQHPHPHPHPHPHDHAHGHAHGPGHEDSPDDAQSRAGEAPHSHGWWGGHRHGPHGHTHDDPVEQSGRGRLGIVGMGLAGGLVPSPSALIVLLAVVPLGRTAFGVLLVLAYGVGMAATLTAVGLLLVRFRERIDRFSTTSRFGRRATAVGRALPIVTAALVLVVGIGLVLRGLVLAA